MTTRGHKRCPHCGGQADMFLTAVGWQPICRMCHATIIPRQKRSRAKAWAIWDQRCIEAPAPGLSLKRWCVLGYWHKGEPKVQGKICQSAEEVNTELAFWRGACRRTKFEAQACTIIVGSGVK
jgi:hypothetical protein